MIPGSQQTERGEEGGEGRERGREGEIPPLITSWVTAPAGRCQNPTLSDVRRMGGREEGWQEDEEREREGMKERKRSC